MLMISYKGHHVMDAIMSRPRIPWLDDKRMYRNVRIIAALIVILDTRRRLLTDDNELQKRIDGYN